MTGVSWTVRALAKAMTGVSWTVRALAEAMAGVSWRVGGTAGATAGVRSRVGGLAEAMRGVGWMGRAGDEDGLMRGGRGCCAAEGAAARRSVRRRRTISRFFNFHLKCAAIRSCILSRILSDPADNTGGGAPLFRPTPEALSRGRGRGSAAAGPAGVCGDESVPIQRHRLLDRNERKECNATGNNHSIIAREFNATSTERMLGKSYRWSLGLFSWPAADREGRFPMNKKIN
jgi:hypothetical protein